MEFSKEKKKKICVGIECASYGCSNTFYNSVGQATGLHPDKQRCCNLIKRQDGKDLR